MPDIVIAPIATAVSCTATVAAQQVISTEKAALAGAIMFVNTGGTAAFCALVSASATLGDAANASPFAGIGSCLFIGASPQVPFAYVSGASAVFAQPVHFLK